MKRRPLFALPLVITSGVVAAAVVAVSLLDRQHNYDSLFLFLCVPGLLLAIGGLLYALRGSLTKPLKKLAVTSNAFAVLVWGYWISVCTLMAIGSYTPREWRDGYDSILLGMTRGEVESVVEELGPKRKGIRSLPDPHGPLGASPKGATSRLYYRGPGNWHHYIYFDAASNVVGKGKRLD